jgi:hypothetical protein
MLLPIVTVTSEFLLVSIDMDNTPTNFDVFLTVHLSINLVIISNLMHNIFIL